MTHRYIKIGVTAVVLVAAFAGLMWTTLQEGTEYYKHVDEVMSNPSQWEGKPMQLHGFVVPGSILKKPDSFEYRFKLQNNGSVVTASYEGIVPDTFKDESEVVLSGKLIESAQAEGRAYAFHTKSDGIMAKCPSKYEASKKVG
jgi:cytochrome c-type biogenesis protein CcmE